jgi:hypothetical protein
VEFPAQVKKEIPSEIPRQFMMQIKNNLPEIELVKKPVPKKLIDV